MELHISNLELEGQKLKCPVCAQTFISNKSLYGHMRNHPERNWRGMKPPIPEMKNNHSSSLPVSDSMDLERNHAVHYIHGNTHVGSDLLSPGWSKTGRRTRPGKALMLIPASDQDLSVSDNEGYDFSVLEIGETAKENLPPKKRKLESAVSTNAGNFRCPFLNTNLIIHGGGSSPSGSPNEGGGSGNNDKIANPGPESSTKGKDSLVVHDSIAYKIPIRARKHHVCDICDRSFKSYQALGGHKAHHNNKAHKIASSTGEDNESSTTAADSVAVHIEPPKGGCSLVHQCSFCNKIFSKGQALGGHKRHCRRRGGGQVTKNQPRVFSFDLNELPPEWIPEEMGTGMAWG
ncbi:hypothetical protein Pfo_017843 [Paulownia fortunei]|nr:hypothetical protein Pfo_017843 [Paulownia fortunei]